MPEFFEQLKAGLDECAAHARGELELPTIPMPHSKSQAKRFAVQLGARKPGDEQEFAKLMTEPPSSQEQFLEYLYQKMAVPPHLLHPNA